MLKSGNISESGMLSESSSKKGEWMSRELHELPEEQIEAVETLRTAMETFVGGVAKCSDSGISIADAFAMIGVDVPLFVRPMLNQLADKLPSRNSESKDSVRIGN